jgi:hypothetical protein
MHPHQAASWEKPIGVQVALLARHETSEADIGQKLNLFVSGREMHECPSVWVNQVHKVLEEGHIVNQVAPAD